MKIYVGNLAYQMTVKNLRSAFEKYGKVSSLIIKKGTGYSRSQDYGFVSMPNKQEAERAINGLNGRRVIGKAIIVREQGKKASYLHYGR